MLTGRALTTVCAVLLLTAAGFAVRRTVTGGEWFCGIDFVQFSITGQHVVAGGDPRVWSPEVRASILSSAWDAALAEAPDSRLTQALQFRQRRSWETYSSPFLYAVFGVMAGNVDRPADTGRAPEPGGEREDAVSSGLATTHSSGSGEKGLAEHYERCLWLHHGLSAAAVVVGCVAFGLALRIPRTAMLLGSALLLFFLPLRSDQHVGNVAQLQFGMLGVFVLLLSFRRHTNPPPATGLFCRVASIQRFVAAIWLGICLAFKPTLLWVPLVWWAVLCRREWQGCQLQAPLIRRLAATVRESLRQLLVPVAGCLTGGLLAVAFSAIWFPLNSWIEWVQAVLSLPDDIIRSDMGNCSPTFFAIHSLGWPAWLTAAAGPVLLLTAAWLVLDASGTRHRRIHEGPFAGDETSLRQRSASVIETPRSVATMVAVACQIQLLTSRLVWYHYLVLSGPALLVLLSRVIRNRRADDRAIAAVVLVWSVTMLGIEPLHPFLQVRDAERVLTCFLANVLLALVILLTFEIPGGLTAAPESDARRDGSERHA